MMTSNKPDGEDFLKLIQRVQVLESVAPTLKDIPVQFEEYDEFIIEQGQRQDEPEQEPTLTPTPTPVPIDLNRKVDPFELPETESKPLSNKELNKALNTVTAQRDILQEHNDFLRPQVAILAEELRIEKMKSFANMWTAIGIAVRWRCSDVALAQTIKENFHL